MIECVCVERHVPLPMTFKQIKVEGQVVVLCPTAYANVMDLLTHFKTHDTVPPGSTTKHYSKFVRELCFKIWRESMTA